MTTKEITPTSLEAFKNDKLDLSRDVNKEVLETIKDVSSDKNLKGYNAFMTDLNDLSKNYYKIVRSEITPELAKASRELRLKIKKVRTSNTNTITADKKIYQSTINTLIAIDKKMIAIAGYMESNLETIEKYEEIIEKDRLLKLDLERKASISQYRVVLPNETFCFMSDVDFDILLAGLKKAKEDAEKAAEKARKEKEKADKITAKRDARKLALMPYISVMSADEKNLDLATLTIANFNKLESALKSKLEVQVENSKKYAALMATEKIKVEVRVNASAKTEKELLAIWFADFKAPELLNEIKDNYVAKSILDKFEMFKKVAIADINRMK